MRYAILAIIITLTLTFTATINAKPLSVNCNVLTDAECSCAAGYVTLAYYDLGIATYLRDEGQSALIWVLHKSIGNCFEMRRS